MQANTGLPKKMLLVFGEQLSFATEIQLRCTKTLYTDLSVDKTSTHIHIEELTFVFEVM